MIIRVTRGIFVVLELFCIWTVVVDPQICTCDKSSCNPHLHIHTDMLVSTSKAEEI